MINLLFQTATRKIIAGLVIAVVAMMIFIMFGRGAKEQAKQDARSSSAVAEIAKEAAKTVIDRAGNDATIDELVEQTAKEIDNATDEKTAGRAARAAICRLPNYRDDPSC